METISTSEFIRKAIFDLNIKQDELAKKIGVSSSDLSRYKHGKKEPRAQVIIKIGRLLELNGISVQFV